jgi:hypothetical protein
MPAPPRSARAPRELLLLLTLATVQFTHIIDFMVMMPLGPQFMRIFDVGPREFGLLVSSYTFAAAASGFVAALWIDRFDRKHALLALYAGFILRRVLVHPRHDRFHGPQYRAELEANGLRIVPGYRETKYTIVGAAVRT